MPYAHQADASWGWALPLLSRLKSEWIFWARQVTVIEDQNGDWLVEYSDAGDGRYVTIFAGPELEGRTRDYFHVLKTGVVQTGIARRARKTCQLGTGNKEYRSCTARHL